MKLRLSPRARHDLQEIGAYLYPRNPAAAVKVRAGIRRQLQVLIGHPQSGRPIGRGLRRSVVPSYRACPTSSSIGWTKLPTLSSSSPSGMLHGER